MSELFNLITEMEKFDSLSCIIEKKRINSFVSVFSEPLDSFNCQIINLPEKKIEIKLKEPEKRSELTSAMFQKHCCNKYLITFPSGDLNIKYLSYTSMMVLLDNRLDDELYIECFNMQAISPRCYFGNVQVAIGRFLSQGFYVNNLPTLKHENFDRFNDIHNTWDWVSSIII